jgi:hypothetical protein
MTVTKKKNKNKGAAVPSTPPPTSGPKQLKLPPKAEIFAALAICILTVGYFFSEQIFEKEFFWSSYWSDLFEQYLPFFTFNVEAFHAGEIPFWNPYSFGGTIHAADPVTQFFYPIHYALYPFLKVGGDFFYLLSMVIVLHYAIFFMGVYYMGRTFKLSFWGSIIASIALTFSCVLICRWQFYPVLYTLAWYPWIIAQFEKIHTQGKWYSVFAAAILLATAFYAGHTQYFFYLVLILALQAGVNLFHKFRAKEEFKTIGLDAAKYLVPIVITLLIASTQIALTSETLPYTNREEITLDYAQDGSLEYKQLLTVVHPKLFGWFKGNEPVQYQYMATDRVYHYWETSFYFGVTAFLFGLVGFILGFRQRWIQWLMVIGVLGFLHALGKNSFLFGMLFDLPGFNLFRIPARTMLFVALGFALLTGYAYDNAERIRGNKILMALAVGVPILVLFIILSKTAAGTFMANYEVNELFKKEMGGYARAAFMVTLLSIVILAGLVWFKSIPKWLYGAAIALLIYVNLVNVNKDYKNSKTNPAELLAQEKEYITKLDEVNKEVDFYRHRPGDFKIRPIRRNHGMLFQSHDVDGFYALTLKHTFPKGMNIDNVMQTTTVLEPTKDASDQVTGIQFIKSPTVPYARMVYSSAPFHLETAYDSFDFDNKVLIDSTFDKPLISSSLATSAGIKLTTDKPSSQEFSVDAAEAGMLVVGRYFSPFWKATVNGKEAQVEQVNGSFQGVMLDKGKSEVRIAYESPAVSKYKMLSLITLVISLLAFLGTRIFKK